MCPVDEVDGLAAATIPAGQAFHRDAAQQQVGGGAVGLQQAVGGDAGERGHSLRQAFVVQPGLAVVQVQGVQLATQHAFLDDVRKCGAVGTAGVVQRTLHVVPAHADQLLDQGALDFIQFPAHRPPVSSDSGLIESKRIF